MKVKIILISLAVIVIGISVFYIINSGILLNCENWYENIENDFNKANFCEEDSDCKAIMLVGPYVEFGCYKFVNVLTDEEEFLNRVEEYDKKCAPAINRCAPAPDVVCDNNKCVPDGCFKKYPEGEFEDCIPGEVIDGWREVILYPNTLDTSNMTHSIDSPVPDIVRQAGIAHYVTSWSTCLTTWSIKIEGEWIRVNQIAFCNYITEYNVACSDCLLEWEGGCC